MTMQLVAPAEITSCRILAIDDEEANVLLLRSVLEREGYTDIHCLTDPKKAMRAYIDLEPDIVLLDLMMPEIDGFELLESFSRHDRAEEFRPILVLTADTTLQARRRALSLGAKDFVAKPFDVIEVGLRIANLLETRILYKRLRAG
ncbi:response regulator [Qipengyuania gaetbuli]|uniref:response regulator n=1 Tax=Qipengyuania gaetbuli TaxID=266952 RepID=UPI001CFD3943|nr:response regulator [Qipengyuania gaetbuli]